MATAHPPEKLASNVFWITFIGVVLWIAAAFLFVILD
jgi:uncharacterized membrane protein